MSGLPGRHKLLYLDDEYVNLFLFEELFKSQFDVLTTSSVEEALKILKDPSKGIEIVITDLKMHPVNGMTFIIRARDEGISIPICVLSAFPKTPEIENGISSGIVSGFFNKPLDVDFIQLEAERLINQHKV